MGMCGIVMAVALTLLGAVPAWAQAARWSLSTSVNYSKGDYGTTEDTEILYVPVTLGVRLDRLGLGVTVPYIHQTSGNVTVTGGGVAPRKDKKGTAGVGDTESGLGDILARASYIVLKEQPMVPEVEPYFKLKFPTADDGRGLGTGEFDETIGVDLSKTFLELLTGYVTLAYTFIGSPPGANLDNSFAWSVGAAYSLARPLSVFAFLDGATAVSPGQEDPLEARAGAEFRLTPSMKLTGSVTKGLSNGSADWGFSAGIGFRF